MSLDGVGNDVGGAGWILLAGGGGGVRGTFSGGIVVEESEVAGLAEVGDVLDPRPRRTGGAKKPCGLGPTKELPHDGDGFPVLVSELGKTAGSDFAMLSLVFKGGFFESAKYL